MAEYTPMSCVKEFNEICLRTTSTCVMEIAADLLDCESLRIHGPEHHYLVSAAVITAYCNGMDRVKDKEKFLEKALYRANLIQPGSCGYFGVCGAVLAVGSAVSIINRINHLSKKPMKELNKVTLSCMNELADYQGPRCCKRATYTSLEEVGDWIESQFVKEDIKSEKVTFACDFSSENNTCLRDLCKYYPPTA